MLNITEFFISSAWAQSSLPATANGGVDSSSLIQYAPYFLIFAVVYVLMIRPQQKRIDEQNKMIKALRRGDRVITQGGIFGKIIRLEGDDVIYLEISEGINIKVLRSQIGGLEAKTDPVPNIKEGDDEEKKK